MSQAADIGVGVMGKEGRQAVNNSDFAIGQFRCALACPGPGVRIWCCCCALFRPRLPHVDMASLDANTAHGEQVFNAPAARPRFVRLLA